MDIGSRVLEFRGELRMTQEDLARLVDVTPNTISMIERGHSTPSVKMLVRLADALSVAPGALLPEGGGPKKARKTPQPR
jgi:transcriptional regulator with XRE-family HTH domain